MTDVAVVTSCYGAYDPMGDPPPQTVDARWVAVTDQPFESDVWDVVVEPRPIVGPRLAAKVAKAQPWFYVPQTKYVVWLDAAARLPDEHALERLLEWADGAPIAQFEHPARRCAYDEGEFSKAVYKYEDQNLAGQMAYYRSQGFPEQWGLWATGVIVYGPGLPAEFSDGWLAEMLRFGDQDQVSEPFVLWDLGTRPRSLPGNVFGNDAVHWQYAHRRWV